MSWSRWLSADEARRLIDRNPGLSLDEIAMRALSAPRYAGEFSRLGAWIESYDEHRRAVGAPGLIVVPYQPKRFPRLIVSAQSEQELARLVVAAMLEEPGAGAGEQSPRGSASFGRKAFDSAVRLLRAGEQLADIERQTGIHRNRVARIRDRYVFPRPGSPEYEAVRGRDRNTIVLRRRT